MPDQLLVQSSEIVQSWRLTFAEPWVRPPCWTLPIVSVLGCIKSLDCVYMDAAALLVSFACKFGGTGWTCTKSRLCKSKVKKTESRGRPGQQTDNDARADEDCSCTALQTHCWRPEVARLCLELLVRRSQHADEGHGLAAAADTQLDQQTRGQGRHRQGAWSRGLLMRQLRVFPLD